MIFRVRYQTVDSVPHVYCALYVVPAPDQTGNLCGTFTVRKEELEPLQEACSKVEFVRQEWDED